MSELKGHSFSNKEDIVRWYMLFKAVIQAAHLAVLNISLPDTLK
jgi:hypothetical protein